MDTNNDSNFISDFAGSLRDRQTELDLDPSGADSVESLYQKVYRLPLEKESFSMIKEMVVRRKMTVITISGS